MTMTPEIDETFKVPLAIRCFLFPGPRTFPGGLLLVLMLSSLACGPPVEVKLRPTVHLTATAGAPRIDDPGPRTLQVLRLFHLDDQWQESPASVVVSLDALRLQLDDPRIDAAQAELVLAGARVLEGHDTERAAEWYFLSALRAWDYLFGVSGAALGDLPSRAFDGRFHETLGVYNEAVGSWIRLRQLLEGGFEPGLQRAVFEQVLVRLDAASPAVDPKRFDRLLPANGLRVRGPRNHYRRDGLGSALVAVRENRGFEALDRFRPPEGIVRPLTALLIPSYPDPDRPELPRSVHLAFYDPLNTELLPAGPYRVPLAADFTTPYAYLAGATNLRRLAGTGLWQAEKTLWHEGIFLLEPYDPRKIPLLMIHGLRASPLTWLELTNDLYGEPDLRSGYQIWHAMYSTGMPFLYSAGKLRQNLGELVAELDPEGDDAVLDSMVVIGHSMGGLLARTLVSNSDHRLWDLLFRRAPEEVVGPPDGALELREGMIFEADPRVDRVIFIAVPHRGSPQADGFMARLGSQMVSIPDDVQGRFFGFLERNPGILTPLGGELLSKGLPSSLRILREDHPMLLALADLPFREGVEYHTILGNRGRGGGPEASDGLVTWQSAHLDGAASELVIEAGHDVHTHPVAIGEIKRILRFHLRELERRGGR